VRRGLGSRGQAQINSTDTSSTSVAVEGTPALNVNPIPPARGSRESFLGKMGISFEILRAFVVIFFPLTCLSAGLIIIVQVLRIRQTQLSPSMLSPSDEGNEAGAYLVRINSSTLLLLSSYCSSIAPALAAFVMGLLSYPISRHLLSLSESRNAEKLPTPFQLGLLITLLTGDTGSLWDWLKYTFIWHTRHKMAIPLMVSALALFVAFVLGYSQDLFILSDVLGYFSPWQIRGCMCPRRRSNISI
jgi:hypothetical protein